MASDAIGSDVAAEVRALYCGDLDHFVAGRAEIAKSTAATGDRAAAAAIRKLRKPSRGAWLLNVLAADFSESVQRVRELGQDLAQAHRAADATALRDLTATRREVLDEATRNAARAAAGRGWQPTQAALTEANETLQAALADPELGERIAAGAMVATVRAAGFGPVDLFAPLAQVIPLRPVRTPAPAAGRDPAHDPESAEPGEERSRQIRRLERQLDGLHLRLNDARSAHEQAERDRVRADLELADLGQRAAESSARVAELRRELATAEAELSGLTDQRPHLEQRSGEAGERADLTAIELADREHEAAQLLARLDELGG